MASGTACAVVVVRAFTLIELLIVMAIVAIIAGMLMAVLGIAQRQGRIANTKSMLMKTDQAIRLFRADMRIYPWQADLGVPPAEPTAWGNALAYRLAWDPPAATIDPADPDRMAYMAGFHADLASIRERFRFEDGRNVPPRGSSSEGTHAFRNEERVAGYWTNILVTVGTLRVTVATVEGARDWYLPGTSTSSYTFYDAAATAQVMTRMAEEITCLRYLAGQLPVEAPSGSDPATAEGKARHPDEDERYVSFTVAPGGGPYGYVPYNAQGVQGDDRRGPALDAAAAQSRGWRGEYLAEELRTVAAGEQAAGQRDGALLDAWGRPLIYIAAITPGVRGFMPALSDHDRMADCNERRYNLGPQGRPPTTMRASDIRITAAPAYVQEFELWSAGIDGRFAAQRDAPENRDNIALHAYARGLQ